MITNLNKNVLANRRKRGRMRWNQRTASNFHSDGSLGERGIGEPLPEPELRSRYCPGPKFPNTPAHKYLLKSMPRKRVESLRKHGQIVHVLGRASSLDYQAALQKAKEIAPLQDIKVQLRDPKSLSTPTSRRKPDTPVMKPVPLALQELCKDRPQLKRWIERIQNPVRFYCRQISRQSSGQSNNDVIVMIQIKRKRLQEAHITESKVRKEKEEQAKAERDAAEAIYEEKKTQHEEAKKKREEEEKEYNAQMKLLDDMEHEAKEKAKAKQQAYINPAPPQYHVFHLGIDENSMAQAFDEVWQRILNVQTEVPSKTNCNPKKYLPAYLFHLINRNNWGCENFYGHAISRFYHFMEEKMTTKTGVGLRSFSGWVKQKMGYLDEKTAEKENPNEKLRHAIGEPLEQNFQFVVQIFQETDYGQYLSTHPLKDQWTMQ